MREILFVAGEVSGDLHASGVARELVARGLAVRDGDVRSGGDVERDGSGGYRLVGVGGDAMRAAGVELIAHIGELAVMGFIEPIKRLPRYRALLRELTSRIRAGQVALVVLIDHAAFNMRVAEVAAAAGVPVLYFITPQVWASRAGRLARLAKTVTRAAVILPFEEALLREHGIDATFVGHPLLDRLATAPDRAAARARLGLDAHARVLALFPGSRRQEIDQHLDAFVGAANELRRRDPSLAVVVGLAPNISLDAARCPFITVRSESLTLLRAADAALCKSGTTTLEAAVAGCPLVVAYRARALDYLLGRWLVTIPHIGLVNIVAGRLVAPEFIQGALQPTAVADALAPLLNGASAERGAMVEALDLVRASLGQPGAGRRVAEMAARLVGGDHR